MKAAGGNVDLQHLKVAKWSIDYRLALEVGCGDNVSLFQSTKISLFEVLEGVTICFSTI